MTYDPLARFLAQRSARVQRTSRLRPMNSNELSDLAVSVYQQLGSPILRHTAVPTLFCLGAFEFVTRYVLPSLGVTAHPEDVRAQVGEALSLLALAIFVGGPLFMIGLSYSSAIITAFVSDFMTGKPLDSASANTRARGLLPRLLLLLLRQTFTAGSALILSGLLFMASALMSLDYSTVSAAAAASGMGIVALLFGAAAVPFVLSRQILAVPVMVVEGAGASESLRRSKQLLRSFANQPSGYSNAGSAFFLVAFIACFIYFGLLLCFNTIDLGGHIADWFAGSPIRDYLVESVRLMPSFFTLWLTIPVWSATATILYFERRTRLEGYDIEVLALDVFNNAKQNRFDV